MTELGRLEKVDLRYVWQSEALDFTPWLAREDNLDLLSDALGIELELEGVEQNVGPFRADILCKDTLSDRWVLIENQLERTDHTHLGQLITYAAGLDAVTIVWIAARVAEEHRAAIDWLNEITDTNVRFFALEVELWRIGSSPAAPKFNMISGPNDWSRTTSNAKKAIEDRTLTEPRQMLLDYWTAFGHALSTQSRRVRAVKPLAQNWITHGVGKSGVHINGVLNRRESWVRGEIYLTGTTASAYFELLQIDRHEIEAELGQPLVWYDGAAKDRRIYVQKHFPDVANPSSWTEQHLWLAETFDSLHRVFHDRVRKLDPSMIGPD